MGEPDAHKAAAAKLSAPDSIMGADVASSIATYMKTGGNPGELIQMLCSHYEGYAQMANLIGTWLVLSGEDESTIRDVAQEHVRSTIVTAYDDESSTAAFFNADKSAVSSWVGEMIRHREWRQLIYDLSDQNPNSLMLSYIIKQIAVAGFQREIAEIKSVSNHLDVFSAVLSDWIAEAVRADEVGLQEVLTKITAMACTSQHAYVFSQALLHTMMNGPLEGAARRISEEVHLACESKAVAAHTEFQLSGAIAVPEATDAVVAILESGRTGHHLRTLHELYTSTTPPSVDALRFPGLLDVLIDEVFVPDFDPMRSSEIDMYTFILAFAVSADDASGYPTELDSTIQAVKEVLEKLHTGILTGAGTTVLFEYLPFPIVARGVLRWLDIVVGHPDFFLTHDQPTLPPHFALLDEIGTLHPLLRGHVLEVLLNFLGQTYSVDTHQAVALKRKLLDRVLFLFGVGHATQVLRRLIDSRLDVTLLVYFLNQVLRHIGPPFSTQIFLLLTQLFSRHDISAVYATKTAERAAVITFIETGIDDLQAALTDDEISDARSLRDVYSKS